MGSHVFVESSERRVLLDTLNPVIQRRYYRLNPIYRSNLSILFGAQNPSNGSPRYREQCSRYHLAIDILGLATLY